ncbi:hypothetical protein [Staphylococcus warneri]|nr:hypothetical protein [Staphylococcus warneri]
MEGSRKEAGLELIEEGDDVEEGGGIGVVVEGIGSDVGEEIREEL